jgi:GrpB-like predicted nucleotidyltransferase (UPF0157 family)
MSIEIIAYQSRWTSEFLEISQKLRAALGDLALRIDHIGSTSVPNLAAKDIIDLQVTVASLEPPELRLRFEQAGLVWREDITQDHCPLGMNLESSQLEKRYAQFVPPVWRKTHVHVRVEGCFNQRYALLCRDYLRTHEVTREAYAQIKYQLARYFPNNAEAYYDIKDPAFDLFMTGAWEWAEWTNWQPVLLDA